MGGAIIKEAWRRWARYGSDDARTAILRFTFADRVERSPNPRKRKAGRVQPFVWAGQSLQHPLAYRSKQQPYCTAAVELSERKE
jgi:hypothetical protein